MNHGLKFESSDLGVSRSCYVLVQQKGAGADAFTQVKAAPRRPDPVEDLNPSPASIRGWTPMGWDPSRGERSIKIEVCSCLFMRERMCKLCQLFLNRSFKIISLSMKRKSGRTMAFLRKIWGRSCSFFSKIYDMHTCIFVQAFFSAQAEISARARYSARSRKFRPKAFFHDLA